MILSLQRQLSTHQAPVFVLLIEGEAKGQHSSEANSSGLEMDFALAPVGPSVAFTRG